MSRRKPMSAASWKEEARYCAHVARSADYAKFNGDPSVFAGYTRMQYKLAEMDNQPLAGEIIRLAGVLVLSQESMDKALFNLELIP